MRQQKYPKFSAENGAAGIQEQIEEVPQEQEDAESQEQSASQKK